MNRTTLRHLAEYLVFRTIVCVIETMPTRVSVAASRKMALVVTRLLPKRLTRYNVARDNIQRAFGDTMTDSAIDRMILDMWTHLFRMVIEMVDVPRKLRLYNCADVIEFRQREATVRATCCGRPVLMVGGHFGNWEVANSTFGWFGFPMGVVARDLDNPWLHRWFERFRRHTGHQMISKKGGSERMMATAEAGGMLALLGDQDAGRRGMFVDFFGHPASTFKSIALLALQQRAVVCVGYARRLRDDFSNYRWVRYELGSEEIIDPLELETDDEIRELTQRFTNALENGIRRSPEQYFWVHRRWKTEPGARRRRNRKAA